MIVAGLFCFGLGLIGLVARNGGLFVWMTGLGLAAFMLSVPAGLALVSRLAAASADRRLRKSAWGAAVACGPLGGISLVLAIAASGADEAAGGVAALSALVFFGVCITCAVVVLRLGGLAKRVQRARATRWRGRR